MLKVRSHSGKTGREPKMNSLKFYNKIKQNIKFFITSVNTIVPETINSRFWYNGVEWQTLGSRVINKLVSAKLTSAATLKRGCSIRDLVASDVAIQVEWQGKVCAPRCDDIKV